MTQQAILIIGGLLLLMGLLHGITIFVLPLVGLIFSANWRRAARFEMDEPPPPDPRAERAEKVVRILVWIALALLGLFVLFVVVNAVAGLLTGMGG